MASKSNKGEILAKFFDDGEYTALFADGAVSAACGYAAGQQAYAVYQNGEAVSVKDVEKNIKVLEMAAQTGCPVVTFYNSVGAKLAEGLDVLTASAKLNATIAKVSGVIPQIAVVTGVCGGTSALSAANADVCVMAEDAELFFTAPFTAAAKGDKVADAGSAAAAAKAGVAAIVAADAAEAAEKAAHIVGLLPANNLTGPAIFEFEQPTAVLAANAEPAKAAAALIDKDSAVEMYAGFGKSVYTAFATIGGNAVGVVSTGKQLCHNCVAKASRFVRLCDAFSVPVLAIVNVVGSSIARAADYVLYTYAGPEIAVASTKAYMVQLCTLYLFAFRLAYAKGRLSEAETKRLTAELLRAGEVIQPRLADCEQIKYLASRFVNTQSCFFIGRGFDYALSLEGSLKLKEISYVHSDAYAAGELKHGTISLITEGVPVIALATQKQVYEKTISNAKETKSRGARVILFTTKDAVVPDSVAD